MEQPGDLLASCFWHVAFVLAIEATYVVKYTQALSCVYNMYQPVTL
jgi:hypothetical protein